MKIHRASVLVLGLAMLAASCKNESAESPEAAGPVVARVGDRNVTLSYFEERLAKMDRQYLPDTLNLDGKKEFLDFIINKELMALKAEALGYAEDPGVQERLSFMRDNLIQQAVKNQITEALPPVTEEEIRAFYDKQKTQRFAVHIMVPTKKIAEEVRTEILNGADFDSMVGVHSFVPRFDADGTEVPVARRATFGWVQFGQTTPAVEEAIYGGPLNEPAPPVQTVYGWHIFKPVSEREERQKSYDDVKELINKQLTGRRERAAVEAYYEGILDAHEFELHEDALVLVFNKVPPQPQQPPDPALEVKPVLPFTHEEREVTLFVLDGKEHTVGDFSDLYDAIQFRRRPMRRAGAVGLRNWIRDEWLKDLQLERAEADGVTQLPMVVNEMKTRREEMMVELLHANLIQYQVPEPTEDELIAYFNENQKRFVDNEKRSCNLIFHPRERVVRRAYKEIQDGKGFVETAIRYNDSAVEPKDVRTAVFTRDDTKHADIAEIAFSLAQGEYSEPFKVTSEENNGWFLLQVHNVIPEQPFAYEDVEEFVRRDWQTEWSENRLNELLEEWKSDFAVEVFDDVLNSAEVRRDDVFVPDRSAQAVNDEPGAADTN